MRATLKEIQADCVDDILAALALYRPGPLTGGLKDAFVRRHLGKEQAQQLHAALTPMLAETYGVILYQEQVLRIAHELAGLSLADADILRRAMSHFDPGKEMARLRERFIQGAAEKHQVGEETASRIWEMMAAFAGYGFPKAHAASYAVVAWRAAWCKTHYPEMFMAAVLAGGGGYYGQRIYLNESRRLGLRVRAPEVNYAEQSFSLAYIHGEAALFMGLDQVRGLTRRAQKAIQQKRPFHSLDDFLTRVDPRAVEAENLAKCGALAEFGTIPEALEKLKGGWRAGQMRLFADDAGEKDDWSLKEKVEAQEAVLGIGVEAHPLELVAEKLGGTISTVEASAHLGERVRVAGVRQTLRRGGTKHYLTLEDLEGVLEVVIEEAVYRRHRKALQGQGAYIIEGVMEKGRYAEEARLVASRVEGV